MFLKSGGFFNDLIYFLNYFLHSNEVGKRREVEGEGEAFSMNEEVGVNRGDYDERESGCQKNVGAVNI